MNKEKRLLVCVVLFWFAQYVYIPQQTPYLSSISVGAGMIGIIVGAYGISQMLLRLPVGVMTDTRNHHKLFIMIGCLASGSASLLRTFAGNGTGFLAANLLSGLASALWLSFMVLYTGYFPETEQKHATSSIIMANNLGILIAFITSSLLYDHIGMRSLCVTSILAGILACLVALGLPKEEHMGKTVSVRALLAVCLDHRLLFFALMALIQQGVQMSSTMSFTSQVLGQLGAGALQIGISSIIYMASAVFWSKMASAKWCRSLSLRWLLPLLFVLFGVYCIGVPLCHSILIIFILQILPGLATGILNSYMTAEAMQNVPAEKKSTAMGFFQAVYALGMTLFPIFCGRLAAVFSMTAAFAFLAGTCLIGALLTGWYCHRE